MPVVRDEFSVMSVHELLDHADRYLCEDDLVGAVYLLGRARERAESDLDQHELVATVDDIMGFLARARDRWSQWRRG